MSKAPDLLDQAAETAEMFLQASIENARQGSSPKLLPKGHCHNCEDPVDTDDQLFCDEFCAEDYEYVESRKRANGHA